MRTKTLILVAMLLLSTVSVSAQSKWKYNLGLGGTFNSGNINNIGFRNTGSVSRNDSILALDASYRYLYAEEKREATNHELGGGAKMDLYQYSRWSPFLATDFVVNHFKGYDFKISLLAGVKYRLFSIPGRCDYSLSAAIVEDYVNYHITDPVADTIDGFVARVSLRGKIKQRIGESTQLNHMTFYQPSITDFGDYIVSSVTKIENRLNQHLFLDIIFDFEHRSVVPEGRKKTDIATEVALRLSF